MQDSNETEKVGMQASKQATEASTTSAEPSSITPIPRTTTDNPSIEPITTTSAHKSSRICTIEFVPMIVPSYHSIPGIKMYFPVKACSGKRYFLVRPFKKSLKQGKAYQIREEDFARIIETDIADLHHFLRS